ncbi:MAG: hypothetical protein H0U03_09640 [Actinobacteria bacterium]|nr:hypothetical protein [Actinomycetota bacterium]
MSARWPAAATAVLISAVGLLALGGCGGEEEPELTSAQVIQHVYRRGGVQLSPSGDAKPGTTILALPFELRELYGGFEIYLFNGKNRAVEALLEDAKPDDLGIYWVRDQQGGWLALSKYGANLILAWFDAPGNRTVSPKWHRLDTLLEELV